MPLAPVILLLAAAASAAPPPDDALPRFPARMASDLREKIAPEGLATLGLSGAAFYVVKPNDGGRLGDAAWAADLGMESFEALLVSGVEAEILKYSVQRERPDGADHFSFPSGHSASAFSVASVLAGEYGWKAGVPAYLGACAVGYTRLELDKHWLSDVVFGAGLGIASGRAVIRAKRKRRKKDGLAWAPYFGPSELGVTVAF